MKKILFVLVLLSILLVGCSSSSDSHMVNLSANAVGNATPEPDAWFIANFVWWILENWKQALVTVTIISFMSSLTTSFLNGLHGVSFTKFEWLTSFFTAMLVNLGLCVFSGFFILLIDIILHLIKLIPIMPVAIIFGAIFLVFISNRIGVLIKNRA